MNIFSSSRRRSAPRHAPARHPISRESSETNNQNLPSEGGFIQAMMAALFALPVTLIIGLILLLIVSAVAYVYADPDRLTTPLALAALGLTSLLGGLVAARRGKTAPVLCGLLIGILFSLCLWCGSLFFTDGLRAQLTLGLSSPALWGLHSGVILMSVAGAKIGSYSALKTQHKRPPRRS